MKTAILSIVNALIILLCSIQNIYRIRRDCNTVFGNKYSFAVCVIRKDPVRTATIIFSMKLQSMPEMTCRHICGQ